MDQKNSFSSLKSKLSKLPRANVLAGVSAAIAVAFVGYLLLSTSAATWFASLNPADGTLSGNASIINDTNGKALQFGNVSTGGGGGTNPTGTWPSAPPAKICSNDNGVLTPPPTAPANAITVPAGNNSSVDFTKSNTIYWFAPGVHTLGTGQFSQIEPGTNSQYIGGPGAILDGQKVNLYAFTQHATGVRIAYLEIRNFGKAGDNNNEAVVNHDAGDNWTIEYNNIHNVAGAGVFLGSNNVVRYNCLKDNGQYGFSMYKDPVAGDSSIKNIVLDHNEIAGNNTDNWEAKINGCGCTGGGKFWDTKGAVVSNNYVHDNLSVALWADTNDIDFLFEGNWIENNQAEAIWYEISYNVAIRNNVIKGNAMQSGGEFAKNGDNFPEAAVYISESGGDSRVQSKTIGAPVVDISHNLFLDNWSGITLWENADRYCNSPANTSDGYCTMVNPNVTLKSCASGTIANAPYYSDCRWKTQNVTISNNEFHHTPANVGNCDPKYCGHMAILSNYGTYPSWSPYKGNVIQKAITYNQNNKWSNNKYFGTWSFVSESTDNNSQNWNTWRGAPYNQDAGSSMQ